jgi:hypothetical protein
MRINFILKIHTLIKVIPILENYVYKITFYLLAKDKNSSIFETRK